MWGSVELSLISKVLDGGDGDANGDSGGGESGGDGKGDLYLLRGGAAISSAIAASMDGGRVNVARTVVQVQSEPVVAHHTLMDPPLRTFLGHAQMARTQCPTMVHSATSGSMPAYEADA
ncbi:hypothetical protein Tco_0390067 [Tanacetum coccineum]